MTDAKQILITGERQRAALKPLMKNPSDIHDIPVVRDNRTRTLRAAIRDLAARGIVGYSKHERKYWLQVDPAQLRLCQHPPLLEALRNGPVRSLEFHRYADTIKSLHVRISQLRKAGYVIDTVDDTSARRRIGRSPVAYHLRQEPTA